MGIIKNILSEEVIKNKGWVELIQFLYSRENISIDGSERLTALLTRGFDLKPYLLPHKIVDGKYISYDTSSYNILDWGVVYDGDDYEFVMMHKLFVNGVKGTKYQFAINIKSVLFYKHKVSGIRYIWFDMVNDKMKSGILGSGVYNYVHDIGDNVRKIKYNPAWDFTFSDHLPYLSEKYPDYFVKTIKTKTGLIQDKVKVYTRKWLMSVMKWNNVEFSVKEIGEIDEEDFELLDEPLRSELFKLANDYVDLYHAVRGIINGDEYMSEFLADAPAKFLGDIHIDNVGYDKDGKLKVFDI